MALFELNYYFNQLLQCFTSALQAHVAKHLSKQRKNDHSNLSYLEIQCGSFESSTIFELHLLERVCLELKKTCTNCLMLLYFIRLISYKSAISPWIMERGCARRLNTDVVPDAAYPVGRYGVRPLPALLKIRFSLYLTRSLSSSWPGDTRNKYNHKPGTLIKFHSKVVTWLPFITVN